MSVKAYEWAIGYLDKDNEVSDYHFFEDINEFGSPNPDKPVCIELWMNIWAEWNGYEWDGLQDRFYAQVDQDQLIIPTKFDQTYWRVPKKYLRQFRKWRVRMKMKRFELTLTWGKAGIVHAAEVDKLTICGTKIKDDWSKVSKFWFDPDCKKCERILGLDKSRNTPLF